MGDRAAKFWQYVVCISSSQTFLLHLVSIPCWVNRGVGCRKNRPMIFLPPGNRAQDLLVVSQACLPPLHHRAPDLLQITSAKHSQSDSLISAPLQAENECFHASLPLPYYIDEDISSTTEIPKNSPKDLSTIQPPEDARSCTPEPSRDLFPLHYLTTQSPGNQHVDAVTDNVDPVTAPPHFVSGPENFVTAPLDPVIPLAEPIAAPKDTTIAPADVVNTPQDPVADTTDFTTAQVEDSVTALVDPVIAPLVESVNTTALPHYSPLGHSLTSEALENSCAQEVTSSAKEITEDSYEAGSLDMECNEGVTNTWMSVCKKKSKRDRKPPPSQAQTPKPLEVNPPQATTSKPAKTSRRRKAPVIYQDDRAMVRQSWEEERVKVALRVPPKRRQHVIGPRGETIRRLRHEYPSVRVTVPPPQDTQCQEVTLDGPKNQVTAAARDITEHLAAIETQYLRREAAWRRQENQVYKVAPRRVVDIQAAQGRSVRSRPSVMEAKKPAP